MISRTAAVAALVLALGGCGEPHGAEQAGLDLEVAALDEDYAAICELFGPELERSFGSEDDECASDLEERAEIVSARTTGETELEIEESEVDEDLGEATVRARNGSDQVRELDLVGDDDGGWQILADPSDHGVVDRRTFGLLLITWAAKE